MAKQVLLEEAAFILGLTPHELGFLTHWGAVPTTPVRCCSLLWRKEVICNDLFDLDWLLVQKKYLDNLCFSKVNALIALDYKELGDYRYNQSLKRPGIYAIKDRLIYVGQSKNIWRRWGEHLNDRYKNNKKSGLSFAVLEFVDNLSLLGERETYWESVFYPWLESGNAIKKFWRDSLCKAIATLDNY